MEGDMLTENVWVPNPEPKLPRPDRQDFEKPWLFPGEDPLGFEHLLDRMWAAVKPSDAIEQILTRDIADLHYDSLRLRRLKANFLDAAMTEGITRVLSPVIGYTEAEKIAQEWRTKQSSSPQKLESTLKRYGLSFDSAVAQTFVLHLDTINTIDQMSAAADARLSSALHLIERHRAALALRLRLATEIRLATEEK